MVVQGRTATQAGWLELGIVQLRPNPNHMQGTEPEVTKMKPKHIQPEPELNFKFLLQLQFVFNRVDLGQLGTQNFGVWLAFWKYKIQKCIYVENITIVCIYVFTTNIHVYTL